MGYVFSTTTMAALEHGHSADPEQREQARAEVIASRERYERYRQNMRSGLFGLVIGRALFTPRL